MPPKLQAALHVHSGWLEGVLVRWSTCIPYAPHGGRERCQSAHRGCEGLCVLQKGLSLGYLLQGRVRTARFVSCKGMPLPPLPKPKAGGRRWDLT